MDQQRISTRRRSLMLGAAAAGAAALMHPLSVLAQGAEDIVIGGGMGSILGGILGAVFMTMVPELLKLVVDLMPGGSELTVFLSPVRTIIFGLLIIGFLVFEPHGLAEMWRRVRRFFHLWPFRN